MAWINASPAQIGIYLVDKNDGTYAKITVWDEGGTLTLLQGGAPAASQTLTGYWSSGFNYQNFTGGTV